MSISNIRAFVEWRNPAVYSGEMVECTITFKNVATIPKPKTLKTNGASIQGDKRPALSRASTGTGANKLPRPTSHKPSHSLTVPTKSRSERPVLAGHRHQRSLSILSISTSDAIREDGQPSAQPRRKHGRASSLHIPQRSLSMASLGSTLGDSPSQGPLSPRQSESLLPGDFALSLTRRASDTVRNVTAPKQHRKQSVPEIPTFPFPSTGEMPQEAESAATVETPTITSVLTARPSGDLTPMPHRTFADRTPQVAKILTSATNNGTPRSSGEFYSMSNNSTETLASEYTQAPSRASVTHSRKTSNLGLQNKVPETLIMGYTQISGSFSLDGSLVKKDSFEELKRRAVVGGQGGGGVVGVESGKPSSGIFGGFGWSNLGDSIGGLLGSNELSSIKEMRGIASSKSIPILSTVQSILFVNLTLAPGESKSFKYSFALPKEIPPTYRGKVIKISYQLTIGTQRAEGGKAITKSVDVPFRVIGGVDDRGQTPTYDLMSPHILLRDQARTSSIDTSSTIVETKTGDQEGTLSDFVNYVESLLHRQRQSSTATLLSPTAPITARRTSFFDAQHLTPAESVERAVLLSSSSSTRFEIARGHQFVGVLTLSRAAFRLGETISALLDFRGTENYSTSKQLSVYAVHATLESFESVTDTAISLRSENSITRVSRKIWSHVLESTLFAERTSWTSQIPFNATPEFRTSCVALRWALRIEFVVPRVSSRYRSNAGAGASSSGGGDSASTGGEEGNQEAAGLEEAEKDNDLGLLEPVASDDRGLVMAAVRDLDCESFEISVPIRVLGAVGVAASSSSSGSGSGSGAASGALTASSSFKDGLVV